MALLNCRQSPAAILLLELLLATAAYGVVEFDFWQPNGQFKSSSSWPTQSSFSPSFDKLSFDFGFNNWVLSGGGGRRDRRAERPKASFASVSQSSKSDSKQSRTEQTRQEVRKHAQSSEWTHAFQDNGQGGVKRLDATTSSEKTAGRSANELKASESGASSQRDQKLTLVNGKPVLTGDTGKQSSFSNSGLASNRTEFSSETSSADHRLAKAVFPPPPKRLATCLSRARVSLVLLAHATAAPGGLARLLAFLDAFLGRLSPPRVVVVFFNTRVLDVVDFYPTTGGQSNVDGHGHHHLESLRRRLALTARGLHSRLADDCNLPAAAAAAERLRRELLLPAPCSLVLFAPVAAGIRFVGPDDAAMFGGRRGVQQHRLQEAWRSFDQLLTASIGDNHIDLAKSLRQFSMPAPLYLPDIDNDASAADVLGRRVCDAFDRPPHSSVPGSAGVGGIFG